ncbi:hypothetical protein PHAVU_002G333000 [Phaseolus vulgaris]|uniref:DUF3741 domain-containing protein n=1 Tax=Phaseolus vulgaris TaxID=3885 RepID=V7CTF8_PHAVU|nr:hypothetical protein PHAVU_002G333000g [Phaseolus vulgaris]ESW32565.1 hypothetical protein PHAVU_002G333000g [Phaseolus vulgaris]
MAKRSDFAQKLLDDLRLRKQRMPSSHTSNQSHHFPIDAYAYTKQAYRGSRNTKANEIMTSRTGVMPNSSSRSHRSVNNGQVSNQMVPYGKGQSSRQTGDMSLALAFAFENGGKLKRSDSIMGFLHHINRGTLEFSMSERQLASTSNYPIQINEISKGAHKLNQILRACSNGLNMDTYSIQFAKELLQGAIDLEESLRMLVDLQNSQFMVTSQKKNRITLLEEDNEDNDDTGMEMQLTRPTFSFDKHTTQNTQQLGKAIFMQRPITLTSSKEGNNSNNENKTVKRQVSQKRSTKTSSISTSGIKNVNGISEGKNLTVSNPEKGRIPNVIAKLMGLDILPDRVEMESKHVMLQKREGISTKHTAKGSTKKTELQSKEADNLVPIKKKKDIEAFKTPATQGEVMISGANKILLVEKTSSELSLQNGKPLLRDLDGMKALKGFDKPSIKVDKQTKSSAEKNFTSGQKDVQEIVRKKDHPNNNNREQKGTVKGRTDYLVLNNMLSQLEQVKERSEVNSSIQEDKDVNADTVQPEKRRTNKNIMNNEKKSRNSYGIQKTHVHSKNGLHEEKHHREQQLQVREEQKLMMRQQGGSEITSKNSPKSPPQKKQLSMNQAALFKKNTGEKSVAAMKSEGLLTNHYDLVRDEASNYTNEKVKEIVHRKSGQIFSPRDQEYERAKQSGIRTLMDERHVYKLASKKIKNTRKQNVDVIGKIDHVLTRRKGAKLINKLGKRQIPTSDKFEVLNEPEQERISLFRETDAHIFSPNEQVYVDATEPLDVKHQPHKEAELLPTLSSSVGGEHQSQENLVAIVPSDLHCQDVLSLQDPVAADERFVTGEVALQRTNGIQEDRLCVKHSNVEDQNICEKSFQQPLTESENCLKWILVMSQLFVNTVEGLFKLNIPFNVLQGGGREIQDEDSKLILDCGYEVMKRKGIRQELKKVHSYSGILMGTTNIIISFDELVRQLNKDIEKLKFYGRKKSCQFDVDDNLPQRLENDVYDKDPDVNCMWDIGWNDETVAFIEKYEVIRDAEKHILSVLLDEITLDFCMFNHTPKQ